MIGNIPKVGYFSTSTDSPITSGGFSQFMDLMDNDENEHKWTFHIIWTIYNHEK